jgi:hypothetical protein
MTIINFHRSGGVIGNVIQSEINLSELPDDEAQHLTRLILESDFYHLPEDLAGQSTPDEFQYTVTIDAGQSKHTVQCTDTTMPQELEPLIKELTIMNALR